MGDRAFQGRIGTIPEHTIIVVGGGPAGMMAALTAAGRKQKVTVMDKMEELGKKLIITGKGRCNLTHQVDNTKELIESFPGGGSFLHSAFTRFSPASLIEFFRTKGLNCKVEKGKRVFPVTDKASDVFDALMAEMKKHNVDVRSQTPVIEILLEKGRASAVKTVQGDIIKGDRIIIATGGMTYPWTGSTGDGYNLAKKVGHTVVTPRPSLVPVEVAESSISHALEGLSLRNIKVTLKVNNKVLDQKFGEMIFTSFGLSGPIILHLSRVATLSLVDKKAVVTMAIDLKPALSAEKLRNRLEEDFEKNRKKYFKNSIEELLPQRLINVFIQESGISPQKQCAQLSNKEKDKLIDLLKNFSFRIVRSRGMSEAEVTQGGIELKEVEPKTMESKVVPGLYFAGEVLDVDGYIGGFNLQAAFSTGYVAGISASE